MSALPTHVIAERAALCTAARERASRLGVRDAQRLHVHRTQRQIITQTRSYLSDTEYMLYQRHWKQRKADATFADFEQRFNSAAVEGYVESYRAVMVMVEVFTLDGGKENAN
jgi:ribosomal protein L18